MSEEMKRLLDEYTEANDAWRDADRACTLARRAAEKAKSALETGIYEMIRDLPSDVLTEAASRALGHHSR
jgi:hypothetical protein